MNFRNMTNMTAGLFTDIDYNATSICMKHGLEREHKLNCHNITGMWPNSAGALLFFQVNYHHKYNYTMQGLPIHSFNMETNNAGGLLENGTFTEALEQLHSGIVDMWATDARMTLQRHEHFLFTTPFNLEKYAALMKRQNPTIFIDWMVLTAGIDIEVYPIMFAILALLFFVSWVNERLQNVDEKNTNWELLLSLLPCNGHMWSHQFGVTRKAFAIVALDHTLRMCADVGETGKLTSNT
jgi:hypothetical protein